MPRDFPKLLWTDSPTVPGAVQPPCRIPSPKLPNAYYICSPSLQAAYLTAFPISSEPIPPLFQALSDSHAGFRPQKFRAPVYAGPPEYANLSMGNIYGGRSFSPSSMEIRKGNPQNAPCLKHTATERIRNIRPGRPAAGASPFYAAPGCFYHNIMQRSLQLLFTALRPFCHSGPRPTSGIIPASDRIPCLTGSSARPASLPGRSSA